MRVIYCAGPLSAPTADGVMQNVERAMRYGALLIRRGWATIVPHLTEFLDRYQSNEDQDRRIPYEVWMEMDFEFVRRADALFLIAPSPGADREVALAEELGITVYRRIEDVPDLTQEEAA